MRIRPSPGIGGLRHALLAWTFETYPEATSATLILLLGGEEFAAIAVDVPGERPRWPGWPRAWQARRLIEDIASELYPEAERADVVVHVGGVDRSGVLPIRLRG